MNKQTKQKGHTMKQEQFLQQLNKYIGSKDVTYIEAILQVCEDNSIDPEDVVPWVTQPLKEKLQFEGQCINILPKTSKLPI